MYFIVFINYYGYNLTPHFLFRNHHYLLTIEKTTTKEKYNGNSPHPARTRM